MMILTTQQLCDEILHIKKGTFSHDKKRFTEALDKAYVWHQEGHKYIIEEKIGELPEFKQGRNWGYTSSDVREYFRNFLESTDLITTDSAGSKHTNTSLAREARKSPSFQFKHSVKTSAEYMGELLRESYDARSGEWVPGPYKVPFIEWVNHDYTWCRQEPKTHKRMEDMTDFEVDEWRECIARYAPKISKKAIEAATDYREGELSDSEYKAIATQELDEAYDSLIQVWFDVYGHSYIPVRYKTYRKKLREE